MISMQRFFDSDYFNNKKFLFQEDGVFRISADRGIEAPYKNGGDVLVVFFEFEDGPIYRGDSHNCKISLLVLEITVLLGV